MMPYGDEDLDRHWRGRHQAINWTNTDSKFLASTPGQFHQEQNRIIGPLEGESTGDAVKLSISWGHRVMYFYGCHIVNLSLGQYHTPTCHMTSVLICMEKSMLRNQY